MGAVRTSITNKVKSLGVRYRSIPFTTAQSKQIEQAVAKALEASLPSLDQWLPEALNRRDANSIDVLNQYLHEAPSVQGTLDIFKGEWNSEMPKELGPVSAGSSPLFHDERIDWGMDILGGVAGKSVFECGPLEAGHSYMLDRAGASHVIAVEANTRAFLKCLVVKELVGMPRVQFLCGDAIDYLRHHLSERRPPFDVCIASGFLYHLKNPVAALHLMTQASDQLLLWTHYYDARFVQEHPALAVKFPMAREADYHGFRHTLHRYEYQENLNLKGFGGGSAVSSEWMSREEVLSAIDFFGFDVIEISFESGNVNGPGFAVAARRK